MDFHCTLFVEISNMVDSKKNKFLPISKIIANFADVFIKITNSADDFCEII